MKIPIPIIQLAVKLEESEPLSKEHLKICEEWLSGRASEVMKVSVDDPQFLEYAALHIKIEQKKESIWNEIMIKYNRQK